MDEETLATHHVQEGSSLDDGELSALKEHSDTRKACDAALRYLSLRAYGEQELYQKLLLRHDEYSAAAAVAKMRELELLDDAAFACAKAAGMAERGKNKAEIVRKMQQLGIDKALAAEAVAGLEMDGTAQALRLLEKSYMDKLKSGQRDKVMAALARRGFSHREIVDAIKIVMENMQDRDEILI
ncbi:recombination regulator RecX [Ruminococcaceae bacterium OttesenSCG-928-O06]|nr:recombination regulator RecX [Ruminococcaceae bacterium OttesenSCG-928-O06]